MKQQILRMMVYGAVLFLLMGTLMGPLCLPKPSDGTAEFIFTAPVKERAIYNPDEDNPTQYALIPGYGSCVGIVDLDEWSLEMTEDNTIAYSATLLEEQTGEESFLIVCLSLGSTTDRLFALSMELHPEEAVSDSSFRVVGDEVDFVAGTTLVTATVFQLGSTADPENITYFKGANGSLQLNTGSSTVGEENIGDAQIGLNKTDPPAAQ